MTVELTQEEKDAAKLVDASVDGEGSKIDKIGDQLSSVETLLKSQVDQKELEPEKGEETNEINWDEITPEELAKSFANDPEKAVEFITRLTEECNLLPQDMVDPDSGEAYIDEEMLKSLSESDETGQRFMSGILYSMQEMNDRTEKKDAVIMQTISALAKSITGIHLVVDEMKKSLAPASVVEKVEPVTDDMPTLGDGVSSNPLTQQNLIPGGTIGIDKKTGLQALRKAFPGNYGNMKESEKYNDYASMLGKSSFDAVMEMIPDGDRALVESFLPVNA